MVSPLPTIVTLAQAKKAARIDPGSFEEDGDLYARLEIATELVLERINNRISGGDEWLETIVSWDTATAPKAIKGAILELFTYMSRYRGDDSEKEQPTLTVNDLPPRVLMYLARFKDPTIA